MTTYYINGYNDENHYPSVSAAPPLPPYDTKDGGAPNFKTLFANVTIQNGDNIVVFGDTIDDTTQDVNITRSIDISVIDSTPTVLVNPTGNGFTFYKSGTTCTGLSFKKEGVSQNNLINILASDIIFQGANVLQIEQIDGNASVIYVSGDANIIANNVITLPTNVSGVTIDTYDYGILCENSNNCSVRGNTIFMSDSSGGAIAFTGNCSNSRISDNILGDFGAGTTYNTGIFMGSDCNYSKIRKNVIGINGLNSSGIEHGSGATNGGINTIIENNVIFIQSDDFGCTGIRVPYKQNNTVSDFKIVNNVIRFNGIITNNDSIAINASIVRGIIDYNDIYNFLEPNQFYNNNAPDVIKEMGSHTYTVNPRLISDVSPGSYPISAYDYYMLDVSSQLWGAGEDFDNVGIGVRVVDEFSFNNYINIVDTVTKNYGFVEGSDTGSIGNNFFNSLFFETSALFNDSYRDGNQVYPSDVYKNQFGYVLEGEEFPFETTSPFYKKDLVYVLKNKRDLSPFPNIECPPNPGYGHPDYVDYETGLWGHPRIRYTNNCQTDPCIIQDVFNLEEIGIQDTIQDVNVWIQDMIDPECATGVVVPKVILAKIEVGGVGVVEIEDVNNNQILTKTMVDNAIGSSDNTLARNVEILEPTKEIGIQAFNLFENTNSNGQKLIIPSTVKKISAGAFDDWDGMTNGIEFAPNSQCEEIGWIAFQLWNNNEMTDDLIIPKSVKTIGRAAFSKWHKMRGGLVFESGSQLEEIGDFAFAFWKDYATMPTDIVIPSTVTSVGEYAFTNWFAMESGMTFESENPPTFGRAVFENWGLNTSSNFAVRITLSHPNADISVWKQALIDGNNLGTYIYSINGVLWDDIP